MTVRGWWWWYRLLVGFRVGHSLPWGYVGVFDQSGNGGCVVAGGMSSSSSSRSSSSRSRRCSV